jgi:hypothetical protein
MGWLHNGLFQVERLQELSEFERVSVIGVVDVNVEVMTI